MPATPETYRRIYETFDSAVSRYDCGRMCAPHNGGEPVCCSTKDAVPIVDKAEWTLLRQRSDLWRRYKPNDAVGRHIVATLPAGCMAVECKGARHCERENRSVSCRAFPFFPYFTRARDFVGLAYYWIFEDRCWVISNLAVVDRRFVDEFVAAYELLFAHDEDEKEGMIEYSGHIRRVFTRRNRIIPLIGRAGGYFAVEPRTHVIRPARLAEFGRHGPYQDETPSAQAAE
jgi:hypothetical protein